MVADPAAGLTGWHDGVFFLRDASDDYRLYVQGRVHADGIVWAGPGVSSLGPDNALKSTFFLRRARTEIAGEFLKLWQWQVSADFAPTSTDNPTARTATRDCTVDATTGAETCSDRTSTVEAPLVRPALTDAFVNFAPASWANLKVGQYLVPFTMENPVSDNTTPFLERSIVSRGLGTPFTRDIGASVWGEPASKLVYYSVGVFNGDGPNRTNADARFDFVGRVFARPFVASKGSLLERAQIGVSGRYGTRDAKLVGYDRPSLTTQGGYAFWKATYTDSASRTMHILPSGEQGAFGADVFMPVDRFDVTAEIVLTHEDTRETLDGLQLTPFTERLGTLKGWAYYAQAGFWVLGSRDVIGMPGYGKPLHLVLTTPSKEPQHGVQVLAKVEQLHLSYAGAARSGALDAKTPNGDIDMTSLSLGMNYWATRHVRVSFNYVTYLFPDSAPLGATATGGPVQSANQRAVGPAQGLSKGADDRARDGGHSLHELSLRFGVQF